jgi:hypothetical protein
LIRFFLRLLKNDSATALSQQLPRRLMLGSKRFVLQAQYVGVSRHAGLGVEADQREKLERLTRYLSRPPVSVERLSLTAQGQVRYRWKTPSVQMFGRVRPADYESAALTFCATSP